MNFQNLEFRKKIGKGALITGGIITGIASIPILIGFGTAGIIGGSIAAEFNQL